MRISLWILICLLSLSCGSSNEQIKNDPKEKEEEIDFDSTLWKLRDDKDYPHRNAMLNKLIKSQRIKRLKKDGVLNLLGPPDRIDNNHLFYLIAQERLGNWPLHTKTMVVKLFEDETVDWVKIHE